MIFVTVGTHEQQFNRLIKHVDELVEKKVIQEEVIMQVGYSTYEPQYCKWSKLFPYDEMEKNISGARIVIAHGGPASFIMPLQIGKVPIVVPRQYQFGEHVNNHQVEFTKVVAERQENIIPIYDINELGNVIKSYDMIVTSMTYNLQSNNVTFNKGIEKIAGELLGLNKSVF